MQYGRIEGRETTLYELFYHMINLYEAAHAGVPCWHEAEYYGMQARLRAGGCVTRGSIFNLSGTS